MADLFGRFSIVAVLCPLTLAIVSGCGCGDDDPSTGSGQADDDAGDDDDGGDWWRPAPGASWQWQLTGTIDSSFDVEMYDVDLFETGDGVLEALRADGRVVVCYFSAGSYENWREDAGEFPGDTLGNTLEGWEDERWLDIRRVEVRQIMESRLDLAAARGCDGVEPDNVDGYDNDTGFDFDESDQLEYNRFIADAAHERGLSVGLKNDIGQLDALAESFDWALNEECHAYDECDAYPAFLETGKAVFNAEYVDDWSDAPTLAEMICPAFPGLSTIIKEWDLTANRLACD